MAQVKLFVWDCRTVFVQEKNHSTGADPYRVSHRTSIPQNNRHHAALIQGDFKYSRRLIHDLLFPKTSSIHSSHYFCPLTNLTRSTPPYDKSTVLTKHQTPISSYFAPFPVSKSMRRRISKKNPLILVGIFHLGYRDLSERRGCF